MVEISGNSNLDKYEMIYNYNEPQKQKDEKANGGLLTVSEDEEDPKSRWELFQ